jgi:hypothetical protein
MVSVPSRASVLDSWWERVSVAHSGRRYTVTLELAGRQVVDVGS